jgi:hypothetical protein
VNKQDGLPFDYQHDQYYFDFKQMRQYNSLLDDWYDIKWINNQLVYKPKDDTGRLMSYRWWDKNKENLLNQAYKNFLIDNAIFTDEENK